MNYYKLKVSYFKIATNYYEQVNQASDSTSIAKVTNNTALQGLTKASSENTGGEWEIITEEQFNQVKNDVLTILNNL